ncbi:MAG: Ig-like domain-containing protein [Pseudomonadota bacterium]
MMLNKKSSLLPPVLCTLCTLCVLMLALGLTACDGGGGGAGSSASAPASTPAPDVTPPSAPTGLAVLAVSPTSINVSWLPATDSVGVVGYRVYRDGLEISAPAATQYMDVALAPNTTYGYAVAAFDAVGNISPRSIEVAATTPALPDTVAPAVSLTAPASAAVVKGAIAISASATDNVGVAGVSFLLDGVALGSEDTAAPYTQAWDTTTAAEGAHLLKARARDVVGNIAESGAITVTVKNIPDPVRFVATGDYGRTANTDKVLARMKTLFQTDSIAFHLGLGDLSYGLNGQESTWCTYMRTGLGNSVPLVLLTGNHEDDSRANGYIGNFIAAPDCFPDPVGVTEAYGAQYWFDHAGQMRIIMISPGLSVFGKTYRYRAGSAEYQWLAQTIDAARAAGVPWVIVGMHMNCLTVGSKGCHELDPGGSGADDLLNLLMAKKVDLVLHGHDHTYQRSKQLAHSAGCTALQGDHSATGGAPAVYNPACVADDGADAAYPKGAGTVFVIAGLGGDDIYPVNEADAEAAYFAKWMGAGFGFLTITIQGNQLSGAFLPAEAGRFTDQFTIGQ